VRTALEQLEPKKTGFGISSAAFCPGGPLPTIAFLDFDEILEFARRGQAAQRAVDKALEVVRCVFCGCTETAACSIESASLEARDRTDVAKYFADRGEELPERVSCWWVSLEPPVCSNPVCRRALAERGPS
jgi:hypothetical protein